MGKEISVASAAARAAFAAADEALDEPLSALCFGGPIERLSLTANTQPAIVATSAAILAALRERWPSLPEPACAAGHSLGEYSALCAAGVLSLADAVRVCRVRGEAMQQAVPASEGAMAAVMALDGDQVSLLCARVSEQLPSRVVSPANYNAPTQTVIAGHSDAVARVGALAREQGGKVITLNVSAPFHCALMAPARDALDRALAEVAIGAPRFEVWANVDAEPKRDAAAVRRALSEQVDRPVQWAETIRRMRHAGITHAIEIGPGRVLAGLARRIDKQLRVMSVSTPAAIEKLGEAMRMSD